LHQAYISGRRRDSGVRAADTGCRVAFQPNAQDRSLGQAQINELVDTPERRAVIESTLGSLYQVAAIDEIEHAGVRGSVATATLKPLPGMPARAGDMINVFYLLRDADRSHDHRLHFRKASLGPTAERV
jgi:hypothetical protein